MSGLVNEGYVRAEFRREGVIGEALLNERALMRSLSPSQSAPHKHRMKRRRKPSSRLLTAFAFVASSTAPFVASAIACNTTDDCPSLLDDCVDFVCVEQASDATDGSERSSIVRLAANPLERGCLHYHNKTRKIRVCNTDDPPSAADEGACRIPDFDYMEIRLLSNNWESAVFESWILQIILSELLEVPTTTETSDADAKINFYDPSARYEFGGPTNLDAVRRAKQLGDCQLADRGEMNYEPCAHVITELWEAHEAWDLAKEGMSEPPHGLGPLGVEGWFVPKFTGERDPSLLSYLGLQGEENRRKLAATFLRPTTWSEYCRVVSRDRCQTSDEVAKRAPINEVEGNTYFAPENYIGHFRATEKNDCDTWPSNCTGHIVDYPCGWSSYLEATAFHLDIALESDGPEPGSSGYSSKHMAEIWMAANHTESNVAMMWWSPDTLYESFVRTNAEFTRINLPPPTQACEKARVSTQDRCSLIKATRVGDVAGACDEPVKPLYKIISSSLFYTIYDPDIPDARRSPAYDAVELFQISGTQLGEIMSVALQSSNPRDGVCQWVVDNMDYAMQFIPRGFPRRLETDHQSNSLRLAATTISVLATIFCLCSLVTVYRQRHRRVIVFAQIEFLYLILMGLLAVSVGAFMSSTPPSTGSCITIIWLLNVGYTLELVPLIAKVGAINRVLNASVTMKRVTLRRKSLYGAVIGISLMVCIYLLFWTLFDPPIREEEYELTESVSAFNETIVLATSYCTSDRSMWTILSLAWRAVLLVCATVLAFQNRHLRQDFNESQTLGLMIYSQFVFVVLRILMYFFLPGVINESTLRLWFSLLYSTDTIATIMIYFVPKFMTREEPTRGNGSNGPSARQWLQLLTRSQMESLRDEASVIYRDRRMRSEMPESELVREHEGPMGSVHEGDMDDPVDGVDCDGHSAGGSEEAIEATEPVIHPRLCVNCGNDLNDGNVSVIVSSSQAALAPASRSDDRVEQE